MLRLTVEEGVRSSQVRLGCYLSWITLQTQSGSKDCPIDFLNITYLLFHVTGQSGTAFNSWTFPLENASSKFRDCLTRSLLDTPYPKHTWHVVYTHWACLEWMNDSFIAWHSLVLKGPSPVIFLRELGNKLKNTQWNLNLPLKCEIPEH